MQPLTYSIIFLWATILQVSINRLSVFAFEFDLAAGKPNNNFAPASSNQFASINFADDDLQDNAGFISGGSSALAGVGGARRLIQPPPLKRSGQRLNNYAAMESYIDSLRDSLILQEPTPLRRVIIARGGRFLYYI